jgi:hypothetical protein
MKLMHVFENVIDELIGRYTALGNAFGFSRILQL